MAEQIYYSVFTKKGLELLTEAIRNGTKLGITSMAFGDGGGSLPVPNENFTSMVREVHRTQLNSLAPDPNNANWLRADAIIASATGGFNIRELGLYAGNVLVAYSNYPPTYKPNPSDGTARIMSFRMILQIDNTSSFDLVIDPDVVLATIQFVDTKFKQSIISLSIKELLKDIEKWDKRVVNVDNDGCYVYSAELDDWIKDEPYNLYDFKNEQPLQYYYNRCGNWDEAIHQAQLNMFTKGLSYTMRLPRDSIIIKKPILGCAALGMYLHSLYPDLKIYDEATNRFSSRPPLVIKGYGRNSSTIIFAGSKDRNDLTWQNFGAIHTAPFDVLRQCSGTATTFYHDNYWSRINLEGFVLYGYNPTTNSDRPTAHGIVAFRGNRAFITDVSVECFNGAGLLFDGFYDSFCKDFEIFQCGRMSPKYGEYLTKNLTDIEYQTYAPLHVMRSNIGDGWDNCNFLRFNGFHIEDCYNAVADIIISGDSSPIWIDAGHIESDDSEGISNLGKKALIAMGAYGVSRFSQDGIDNYNYGSEEYIGNGGGYAIWNGGACYALTYNQGILMKGYTQLSVNNFSVPNSVNVSINAGNTSAKFEAANSKFNNVVNSANDAQISLTDCEISSYSQNYGKCPKMTNVKINGEFEILNNITTLNEPLTLNKVTCTKANGIINFGNVDLFISGNEQSNLYVYVGTYNVFENYIQNNLGAI